mgnify:CR=1 FL=1
MDILKIILGIAIGYVAFFYSDIGYVRQVRCSNLEEFASKKADLIYDLAMYQTKGNDVDKKKLELLYKNDRRISYAMSPYAQETDFQYACDAMDEIAKKIIN